MEVHSIRELWEQAVMNYADQVFLYFEDEKYTFAFAEDRINRIANGLLSIGVKKGSHVAVILENCSEFVFSFLALAKLGAVLIPINIHYRGEILEYALKQSDAEYLIVDQKFVPYCQEILPNTLIRTIIYHSEKTDQAPAENQLTIATFLENCSPTPPPDQQVRPDDLLTILFTSGTTGPSKGVMHVHESYLITGYEIMKNIFQVNADDIVYTCLPMFHIHTLMGEIVGVPWCGIPMVLAKRFHATNFWEEMRKYRVTVFIGIGAMLTAIFKQPEKQHDQNHSVRLVPNAATPKEIWKPFEERFNTIILECYGSTETCLVATGNPIDNIRLGSIGKPVNKKIAKVVDEKGEAVGPNVLGELVFKGAVPNAMMKGYYKMPEAEAEVLRNGWFHSGDRGYVDEDGYFYFVDRIKDCLRVRGENVSSFEVEKVLNSYPKVAESAVVGVLSPELGDDDIKAYIVPKGGEAITPEEIMAWCEGKMAYFMIPRYVKFVQKLPKTPTERVNKVMLRKEKVGDAWDRVKSGYKVKK